MHSNHRSTAARNARPQGGSLAVLLLVVWLPVWPSAQTKPAPTMDNRILALLSAEEFKDERKELVGMGPSALPVLSNIFLKSQDELELVRIMSVLRGIGGDKQPFLAKIVDLARSGTPAVQTGALTTLAEIGSAQQAKPLEDIVAGEQLREAARVNAARALAKIGRKESIPILENALGRERLKPGTKILVEALESSLKALTSRYKR